MIDSILTYLAANDGAGAVVPPCSLTIKGPSTQTAYIVAYAYDGISAGSVALTCATNPSWEAAGFTLPPTSDGTAVGAGRAIQVLPHKIPVRGGDVLIVTHESGANPSHCDLWVDYPGGIAFTPRNTAQQSQALYVGKLTVAGGTNCAAGTFVRGATTVGGFMQGRTYNLMGAFAIGAFTTTAFLGLRKLGANNMLILPIPLTMAAQDMTKNIDLPTGVLDSFAQGDQVEIYWSSVSAEQPTAQTLWVY